MSGRADTVAVTIRIAKGRAASFDEVVRALAQAGLREIEPYVRLRLVNGSVEAGRLETLRQVPGVASVRPDETYRTQDAGH